MYTRACNECASFFTTKVDDQVFCPKCRSKYDAKRLKFNLTLLAVIAGVLFVFAPGMLVAASISYIVSMQFGLKIPVYILILLSLFISGAIYGLYYYKKKD